MLLKIGEMRLEGSSKRKKTKLMLIKVLGHIVNVVSFIYHQVDRVVKAFVKSFSAC